MKTKKPPISFQKLRRTFEQSGFEVVLKDSKRLTTLSVKKNVRKRTSSQAVLGLILPDESQIAVNKSLPLDDRVKTLLHEMIHLYDPQLSEDQTEEAALALFDHLSEEERGYLEFLAS